MLPWILNNKRNHKKVTNILLGLFLATFFVFSFVPIVHAQGDTFGVSAVGNLLPLGGEDIRVVIAKIIRIALSLLGIIAVGIMLYAGFTWMTSGGNEDKIGAAKKTLINATIGLAIIMMSFAIVQFVLKSLQEANGIQVNQGGAGGKGLDFDSFLASGSLGRAIKDHYPLRDQKDVKRNTRIAVTFREAVDPASLILDSNNNQIFGDCINNLNNPNFNWGPDFCDQINTSSIKIFTGTSTPSIGAAALALPEGPDRNFYTFLFRPLALLGSDAGNVEYTVDLTNEIKKSGGEVSVFAGDRHGHYMWKFETDSKIDVDPPHIVSVYPENGTTQARNSIVQITFNEAMDPSVVIGMSGGAAPLTHLLFQSQNVTGAWRLSNGYKTVEFVSTIPCGQNSCGETMYCLPVNCADGDSACSNPYRILARTALSFNQSSFEAIPFSGVMDMAGNALDNGPQNIPDGVVADPHRPGFVSGEETTIHEGELAPDNYSWGFAVSNRIDREAPYIEQVSPNFDQENIAQFTTLTLKMSKRMYSSSLDTIALEEYPSPADLAQENKAFNNLGDIWFRPSLTEVEGKSIITVDHRQFGPQGTNFYYFPIIPSSIKSVTQNCLYPGRGPYAAQLAQGDNSVTCQYQVDENGQTLASANCLPFPANVTTSTDTGCVQYSDQGLNPYTADTQSCLDIMKDQNISPYDFQEVEQ